MRTCEGPGLADFLFKARHDGVVYLTKTFAAYNSQSLSVILSLAYV